MATKQRFEVRQLRCNLTNEERLKLSHYIGRASQSHSSARDWSRNCSAS
jgi:hypothetical protein